VQTDWFRPFKSRAWLAAAALTLLGACSGPNGPAPPPPAENIALKCPADIVVENVAGPSTDVHYAQPQSTGGVPPITITCTPGSGSVFPLGSTTVNCNATDGVRQATCPFSVTLVALPVLGGVRFLAFGDSLTNGELQNNPLRPMVGVVERDKSYPSVLASLLAARYVSQTVTMINEGQSGESADDGSRRIVGALARNSPDALLLLEGIIDLNDGPFYIDRIKSSLRSDIAQARARGVKDILLSTLLPQKAPAPGFPRNNIAMPYIDEANVQIRALADIEGVLLVDSYAAMAGQEATLIGGDGLHPTQEGYVALANAFFAVIKSKLEVPPAPAAGAAWRTLSNLNGPPLTVLRSRRKTR
jgi:lysophospholipase L1-like esterase